MLPTIRPLRKLAVLFALTTIAHAQADYLAKKIVFKNPGLFSQQQLETVSGMHPGSTANAKTMAAAAQRLADTGYFDDIGCTLDGTFANTSVVFALKPTPTAGMVRVGYENFVWLTPAEIHTAILAKFPLFVDILPETSPAVDIITGALTEALAAKGITARVDHDTLEPTLEHPFRILQYRILSPTIAVANIHLKGVSPALVPLIQKSVNATANTLYNEAPAGRVTSESILRPLLDAGYAKAALTDITLAPSPVADTNVPLVISAALNPGEIYHVSHITFDGSPRLSAAAFAASQKLHDGDIANHKLLLETLAPLDFAYRRQGYLDVIVNTAPAYDNTAHTVAYTITVTPGEQYHFNQLTTNGLDAASQQDYEAHFDMKKGDIFSPEAITGYIPTQNGVPTFNSTYKAKHGTWKAYADPNTHMVDLVVTFGDTGSTSITVH